MATPAPSAPARTDLTGTRVAVVGAGRVGPVLGAALRAAGLEVTAVTARSAAARARVAALLPGVPVRTGAEAARQADVVVLAVPDDALPEAVRETAGALPDPASTLVVHTSGRHGLVVLDPVARAGALTAALHPVLPFTGTAADLPRLAGASVGVTAPDAALPVALGLVERLGARPVLVADALRPLWHAALAHGANHLVTLVASAADLLRAAGADDPARVLRPLLQAALDDALARGDAALTGPVSRGDTGTVAAHLAALPGEVQPAYRALADLTAVRAVAAGRLRADRAEGVRELLRCS